MQSPFENGHVWVCWSNRVMLRSRNVYGAPVHAQSIDHGGNRTLCGIKTDGLWDFVTHGPGDGGVTCKRCISVIEAHDLCT